MLGVTGGLADLYKKSIKANCKVDKDLTIKGIIKITRINKILSKVDMFKIAMTVATFWILS